MRTLVSFEMLESCKSSPTILAHMWPWLVCLWRRELRVILLSRGRLGLGWGTSCCRYEISTTAMSHIYDLPSSEPVPMAPLLPLDAGEGSSGLWGVLTVSTIMNAESSAKSVRCMRYPHGCRDRTGVTVCCTGFGVCRSGNGVVQSVNGMRVHLTQQPVFDLYLKQSGPDMSNRRVEGTTYAT